MNVKVGLIKLGTRFWKQWLGIGLAITMLFAVMTLLFATEDTANVTRQSNPKPAPVISVVQVSPDVAVAHVMAIAELRPRWDVEIRAAVPGRITRVQDAALAGERVASGTQLLQIDKTPFNASVAAAERSLEEAKLELWRAKNAVTIARDQLERANVSPPNELSLRLPQLRIAERTVTLAEAELAAARRQLADTSVTAPFSGIITERNVSVGQMVTAGEPLVRLADDRRFELIVELNEADWALLDHPISGSFADLYHRDGTPLGQARIRQGGGYLNQQTRQLRVFLEVINPGENVLAGDLVKVGFTGRTIDNTLSIPESALTRAGHVWMVSTEGQLVRVGPEILFRKDGMLVIPAPEGEGPWQIAITPLASFLPGQRVDSQMTDG